MQNLFSTAKELLLFVNVTYCVALVAPTAVVGNVREVGETGTLAKAEQKAVIEISNRILNVRVNGCMHTP